MSQPRMIQAGPIHADPSRTGPTTPTSTPTNSAPTDGPDVFDRPALWRYEAAAVLGVEDADLPAAMSPGPTFPAALRAAVAAIPTDATTVVDLGAGTGGASEWVRGATGATVIAVEPTPRARLVARLLFPDLRVMDGTVDRVALASGCSDVVTMWGVASLLPDLGGALAEASRLLRDDGHLVLADLVSADDHSWRDADNTFRSIEDLELTLLRAGFSTVSVGCGHAAIENRWVAVARSIDEWIEQHCTERDGFERWRDDKRKLSALGGDGAVLGAVLVARRVCDANERRAGTGDHVTTTSARSPGSATSVRYRRRVPTAPAPADPQRTPDRPERPDRPDRVGASARSARRPALPPAHPHGQRETS